jgi:rhamnose utilization protein RhaD (predicted bifunctional aldolase and dehydrogenase)
VYRANLIGTDPALVKEGGGNFSTKGVSTDIWGNSTEVLWMSAWGCDGGRAASSDFVALRIAGLLPLRDSGPISESEMMHYLLASRVPGELSQPGIETLTHAFIPAPHVDHTHPDAVIALTSFPGGRKVAEREFGLEAIWFDYRQFDVDVARELADRIAADPRCRFVLLAKHGLFTWGETSEECYRRSHEAVARATRALDEARVHPADLGGRAVAPLPEQTGTDLLVELLPVLRGALSGSTDGLVLHIDRSPAAVEFASSRRGPALTARGPACPDHLVTVGYRPLVVDTDLSASAIRAGVARHRAWYDRYYETRISAPGRSMPRRSGAPVVTVLPGVGVVAAGEEAALARLCLDHFRQTMTVIRAADAAGGYVTLSEAQGLADEYWPLMRLKPQLRPPSGPLAGRVLLTDVEDAELADELASAGAHLALTGSDPDLVATIVADVVKAHGERHAVALPAHDPIADPAVLVAEVVLAYGGLDGVVETVTSDAGAPLTGAAVGVFERQGSRGSAMLIDRAHDPSATEALVSGLTGRAGSHLTVTRCAGAGSGRALAAAVTFFASTGWSGTVRGVGR